MVSLGAVRPLTPHPLSDAIGSFFIRISPEWVDVFELNSS